MIDLSRFVNAADISGADAPHVVVEKLQRAIDAAPLAPSEIVPSEADTAWVNALRSAASTCAEIADRYPGQHARDVVLECVKAINAKANDGERAIRAFKNAAPQGESKARQMDGEQRATTDPSPAAAAMSSDKRETPRTDDFCSMIPLGMNVEAFGKVVDFARQLERELAEAYRLAVNPAAALAKLERDPQAAPSATLPKLPRMSLEADVKELRREGWNDTDTVIRLAEAYLKQTSYVK